MFPFNLLSTVIVFALLLPNSVCLHPQYYDCLERNMRCGTTYSFRSEMTYSFRRELSFPFRTRGCGVKDFQIDCAYDLSPVLKINSTDYNIFDIFPGNQSFTMVTNKSIQKCLSSSNGDATRLHSLNSIFSITHISLTNITVFNCHNVCTPSAHYSGLPCSLPQVESLTVELLMVHWNSSPDLEMCRDCEERIEGYGYCGYNSTSDLVCFPHHPENSFAGPGRTRKRKLPYCETGTGGTRKRKLQVIESVAVGIGILLIFAILLVINFRKKASDSKVEKFLQDFTHEMPTRYSYSKLKKVTNNFADKLGEGGFGVVYKGKLINGNLVAVKILDQSRKSESQFMNEVATIGRIHHLHLVRLVGYCFEGFRSALVYEYMVNGSLEKFIFMKKEKTHILSGEQLYSISLGAARGIAYLHEDCDRRIIHFDIKPHNILLDANFTAKVSDFGLAQLWGRLDDHISITTMRGTPGYVAPELWSRNLGPITAKVDVYSFGMMLLEIVGGRKNIDVQVSRSSEIYLPDWAFKLLEKGDLEERLRGQMGDARGSEDDTKLQRMCKVGLWCIQYNAMDRPTMSKVVEMLEGKGDEVSNPPFPFNSVDSPKPHLISCEESSSI